jgi:hypothetical protein
VGAPFVEVDPKTMKAVGSDYTFSGSVKKTPKEVGKEGETIPKGVFQLEQYRGLSALLCSRAEAANRPSQMGAIFSSPPILTPPFHYRRAFGSGVCISMSEQRGAGTRLLRFE